MVSAKKTTRPGPNRAGARPAVRSDRTARPARPPLRRAPPAPDLRDTFAALKSVLAKHARHLQAVFDTSDEYTLNTRKPGTDGKPLLFGSVQMRPTHVLYQFPPMQLDPALGAAISPTLRRHLQGKRDFTFTAVEPAQLEELDLLTRAGMASVTRRGLA